MPSSTPSAPLFEAVALSKLRRLGGDALVRRMIDLFVERAGERVESLRAAQEDSHPSQIRMVAHSLKTSAGILGASRLLQLATDTEAAAETGASDQLRTLTDELCRECDRAATHFAEVGASL